MVFEVSVDGENFTELHRQPNQIVTEWVEVELQTESFGFGSSQPAMFDNLGGGGAFDGDTEICSLSDFFDDFEDGVHFSRWGHWSSTPSAVAETGGLLVLTPPTTGPGVARANTVDLFSFSSAKLEAEVIGTPNDPGVTASMSVVSSEFDDLRVRFALEGQTLRAEFNDGFGPNVVGSTPFGPAHRWWRLSHDVTTDSFSWETSPDGISWAVLGTNANGFLDTTSIEAMFETDVAVDAPAAEPFSIGRVNVP